MAIDSGYDRLTQDGPASMPTLRDAPRLPMQDVKPTQDGQPALLPAIAATLFVTVLVASLHNVDLRNTTQPPVNTRIASNTATNASTVTPRAEQPRTEKLAPARIVGAPFIVPPREP